MVETLTLIFRTYVRAFVSQGVGVIGLAWCLVAGQAGFATLLTVLVLVDQAIFLRGRFAAVAPAFPFRRLLDGWCVAVSGLDILICFATIIYSGGLRDGMEGSAANSPLDGLAYALAAYTHGPTNLVPATAFGRLLGSILAALGALTFLAILAAASRRFGSPAEAEPAPDRSR